MNFYEFDFGSVVLDVLTYNYQIVENVNNDNAWFCGYISVLESSQFFGMDYNDVQQSFMSYLELIYDNGCKIFGFDIHHVGMKNLSVEDVYDMTMDCVQQN